jgi:hypothetical protein
MRHGSQGVERLDALLSNKESPRKVEVDTWHALVARRGVVDGKHVMETARETS